MSSTIDNLLAFRILSKLTTPFKDTDAYKYGLIDTNGVKLKKPKTEDEKDSYNYLDRLVFNVKRLINKTPGGENKIKNIIAALYLIKESYRNNSDIDDTLLDKVINTNVILAEETIQYKMFMEDGEGGSGLSGQGQVTPYSDPVNRTGAETSTDISVYNKKKPPIVKRQNLKQVSIEQPKEY